MTISLYTDEEMRGQMMCPALNMQPDPTCRGSDCALFKFCRTAPVFEAAALFTAEDLNDEFGDDQPINGVRQQ